ncbi:MAG TPA: hypothetical protein VF120_14285 [Ktedonobacterales bacterium]
MRPPPKGFPAPPRYRRQRHIFTLMHMWHLSLVLFVAGVLLALAWGVLRHKALIPAIVETPQNPLAVVPAFIVVAVGAVRYYRTARRISRLNRVYQAQLTTMRRLLLDVHAPLAVRERAALAIARMEPATAQVLLHAALRSYLPFNDSPENVARFRDGIGKAAVVAVGVSSSLDKRLAAAADDPDSTLRFAAGEARYALSQL